MSGFELIPFLKKDYLAGLVERTPDDYWCRCPLPEHDDSTPSFHITGATGVWYCFGCLQGGGASQLIARVERISEHEAWAFLRGQGFIERAKKRRGGNSPSALMLARIDRELDSWNVRYIMGRKAYNKLVRKKGKRWAARSRWYKEREVCENAIEQLDSQRTVLMYRIKRDLI